MELFTQFCSSRNRGEREFASTRNINSVCMEREEKGKEIEDQRRIYSLPTTVDIVTANDAKEYKTRTNTQRQIYLHLIRIRRNIVIQNHSHRKLKSKIQKHSVVVFVVGCLNLCLVITDKKKYAQRSPKYTRVRRVYAILRDVYCNVGNDALPLHSLPLSLTPNTHTITMHNFSQVNLMPSRFSWVEHMRSLNAKRSTDCFFCYDSIVP